MNLPLFYFTYFILVFVFSLLMNNLFLKFSKTLGVRKNENTIRWSEVYKPALGGITFYITFLISIITYSLFFASTDSILHSQILGLIAACTIAFIMGLADDAYNTNPPLKFSTQVFCGIVLIYSGIYIQTFENIYLNYAVTMLWVVGLMNAINLLDNMDAISSVVVLSALITMLSLLFSEGGLGNVFLILLLGITSAIFAFLFYNWHPSKMYMGDTGTQFLGIFLATLSILFLWNYTPEGTSNPVKQILSAILAFALPIIDTTIVFFNRLLKGTSPFVGGKDHTTHHFFYLGFKEPQIAFIYIIYSALSSLCVIIINKFLFNWTPFYSAIIIGFLILSFAGFFTITKIEKKNDLG